MYSSEDFFFFFKDIRKKVVEVQIDGIPVVNNEENSKSGNPQLRAQ